MFERTSPNVSRKSSTAPTQRHVTDSPAKSHQLVSHPYAEYWPQAWQRRHAGQSRKYKFNTVINASDQLGKLVGKSAGERGRIQRESGAADVCCQVYREGDPRKPASPWLAGGWVFIYANAKEQIQRARNMVYEMMEVETASNLVMQLKQTKSLKSKVDKDDRNELVRLKVQEDLLLERIIWEIGQLERQRNDAIGRGEYDMAMELARQIMNLSPKDYSYHSRSALEEDITNSERLAQIEILLIEKKGASERQAYKEAAQIKDLIDSIRATITDEKPVGPPRVPKCMSEEVSEGLGFTGPTSIASLTPERTRPTSRSSKEPIASSTPERTSGTSQTPLYPGQGVVVLDNCAQYAGQVGSITKFLQKLGKWGVKLESGTKIALHEESLKPHHETNNFY